VTGVVSGTTATAPQVQLTVLEPAAEVLAVKVKSKLVGSYGSLLLGHATVNETPCPDGSAWQATLEAARFVVVLLPYT
jgi:hypothetical protein